jgi:simple sugar transport system ATP-binding protein
MKEPSMTKTTVPPLLDMRGIVKRFGDKLALNGVDFAIGKPEIVGLVGDNGAGKSTLIKTITGVYRPDEGTIYHHGKEVTISNPAFSQSLGIEPVHQRGATIPEMEIWENFFLGRESERRIGPFRFLDRRAMRAATMERTAELGIHLRTSDQPIGNLSGGEQQAVMIGRAIHFGGELLLLDEPTSALSIRETNKVLGYVEKAKEDLGRSVVFITHIMRHIYPIADRFVVLWQGRKIADMEKGKLPLRELEELVIRGQLQQLAEA